MKFAILIVLSALSLNVMAGQHLLSSSTSIKSIGDSCHQAEAGRLSNMGFEKACFEYNEEVVQTKVVTDEESRGAPVPGAVPYTTSHTSKKSQCVIRTLVDADAQERCESARASLANHIRR